MSLDDVDQPGTFAPRPGAAPLSRMVRAQASMEARLLLRNGEQLLLALVIPLIALVGGVTRARGRSAWTSATMPSTCWRRACWPWR